MSCDNPKCKNYVSAHDRKQEMIYINHIKIYLLDHEGDIGFSVNDYGGLYESFKYFIGRNPEKKL